MEKFRAVEFCKKSLPALLCVLLSGCGINNIGSAIRGREQQDSKKSIIKDMQQLARLQPIKCEQVSQNIEALGAGGSTRQHIYEIMRQHILLYKQTKVTESGNGFSYVDFASERIDWSAIVKAINFDTKLDVVAKARNDSSGIILCKTTNHS